jgi:hypothetical protein
MGSAGLLVYRKSAISWFVSFVPAMLLIEVISRGMGFKRSYALEISVYVLASFGAIYLRQYLSV